MNRYIYNLKYENVINLELQNALIHINYLPLIQLKTNMYSNINKYNLFHVILDELVI